jgi:hypothetical protein
MHFSKLEATKVSVFILTGLSVWNHKFKQVLKKIPFGIIAGK